MKTVPLITTAIFVLSFIARTDIVKNFFFCEYNSFEGICQTKNPKTVT